MNKILASLAWLLLATPLYAANVNIDALPAGTAAAADLVECEQGGVNKKCNAGDVGLSPALTGNVTKPAGNSATTVVSVPGSALPALTGGDCNSPSGSVVVTCPNQLPQVPYMGAVNMYFTHPGFINTANTVITAGRLYMLPVYLPAGYAFTTLAVSVNTGQAGGSSYLGLYSTCFNVAQAGCGAASFGQPNALLASGGTSALAIATTSTTPTQAITFTTTYTGLYYLAMVATATGTMPTIVTYNAALFTDGVQMASGGVAQASCLFRAFTFPTGVGLNASEAGNTFSISLNNPCPLLGIR